MGQAQKVDNGSGVKGNIEIEIAIDQNAFGGFGIEYNGGSPTMIKNIVVEWK